MDLMELLKTRRSFRRFDQSRPVPDSVIQKIARAQQYASCSGNSQSLRYIMVSDPALEMCIRDRFKLYSFIDFVDFVLFRLTFVLPGGRILEQR